MPFAGFPDFDACLVHMMKPKSEGGGGYDEETARKVCGKLQAQTKEGFSWAGSIKEMPGVGNLIRGKALHPIKTYHYEEWPEVREYLEEELEKSAHTLAGKPLLLDHYQVLQGKVLGAEYEDGAIEYVAQLNDPGVMELIRKGAIKHCSVEFEWKSLEQVNGVAPRGLNFTGLSLLRLLEPGDPMSSVEVWEGIVKQLKEAKNVRRDVIEVKIDLTDRASKEMKAFGNKLTKFLEKEDWLQNHPQYLRGPAPAEPGIQPAGGDTGVMRLSNQNGEKPPKAGEPKTDKERFMAHFGIDEEAFQKFYDLLGDELLKLLPERGNKTAKEAEWDTEYINDLPDSAFAYVEDGGEKDEQGKTVPRSLRHLPFKNVQGNIDHDHLVNALARVKQSKTMPEGGKRAAIEKLCAAVRSWNREHEDKIQSDVCDVHPEEGKEQQGEQEPEKDEHGCIIGKERYDEEQDKCVPITTEQQGNQEPEKDERGCLIGKERYDEGTDKCVPITAEARIAFLETSLKLKEQDELTEEEIKQKIADLTAQRDALYKQVEEIAEEERAEIQKQIDVLYAEIEAYTQALAAKITGQAAPPEETPAKPETAGEAIIPSGTPQPPVCVVPVEKLEGIMPSLQAERSMSWGAQRFVQDVKRLIREAKGGDIHD